jgi:hypothetical protein
MIVPLGAKSPQIGLYGMVLLGHFLDILSMRLTLCLFVVEYGHVNWITVGVNYVFM